MTTNWNKKVAKLLEDAEIDEPSRDIANFLRSLHEIPLDFMTFTYMADEKDQYERLLNLWQYPQVSKQYSWVPEDRTLFEAAQKVVAATGIEYKITKAHMDIESSRESHRQKETVFYFQFGEDIGIVARSTMYFSDPGSYREHLLFFSENFRFPQWDNSEIVPLTGKNKIQDSLKDLIAVANEVEAYARKNDLYVSMGLEDACQPFFVMVLPTKLITNPNQNIIGDYGRHIKKFYQMLTAKNVIKG
ncbi:MAG: hypothetical protein ABIJ34_01195 [archaeon]